MLRFLTKKDKEELQRGGYMYEHLLCLYSQLSNQTALYKEDFPVFLNNYGEADVILFGIGKKRKDRLKCIQQLTKLFINKLNIVSPIAFHEFPNIETRYVDWDFHISVNQFDFNLEGSKYKKIRYSLKQVKKMGYERRLNRKFTANHFHILSRYLARHQNFDVWDYEELLSLENFFKNHNHGLLMEAYKDDKLIGFDVVDFFEDTKIMVVPLGIYLQKPLISDFMMYENLKFAKDKGYEWIDVGPACGVIGLEKFKKKWFATPKFKLFVQTLNIT